jgi:hypothetical protein
MALSAKEAAMQAIEQLPADVSSEELLRTVSGALTGTVSVERQEDLAASDVAELGPVTYHLEREGHLSVLVPDRPVPPLTVDIVNDVLDQIRREREMRFLGLSEDSE